MLPVPVSLQSQTQRKRTEHDSDGRQTAPSGFLFTAGLALSRWFSPKPSTSLRLPALRVMLVIVSLPSNTQACCQTGQSSAATQASAHQQEEGNTCDGTDDNTGDGTTAKPIIIRSFHTNRGRTICVHRRIKSLRGCRISGLSYSRQAAASASHRRRGRGSGPDGGASDDALTITANICSTAAGTSALFFADGGIAASRTRA